MSNKNDRWSALSMKERADLMNMYITNGISDLKEMKKHYNGIPYRDLNTSNYDYFNASPEMTPTEEGQHWDSRNPHTGQILKSENHPTFDLAVEGEKNAGYKIVRGYNGELYSIPNTPDNYVENYNSFSDGGDILYYDDTYIEPAVVTASRKTSLADKIFNYEISKAIFEENKKDSKQDKNILKEDSKPKSVLGIDRFIHNPIIKEDISRLYSNLNTNKIGINNIFSGEENHPTEVQQGLQNGTIKAIKKDDGTYAYIRQEKPIEDLTQSIAEWTTAGDLMDAGIAIDAAKKGDLKQAALLAGLAVVPNAIENTVKLGRRVITHNLIPDKLNAVLKGKWGKKMANPSMAIRKVDEITTDEYGPITFLGKPEMLDDSFIFRGDGDTSMVKSLGLDDVDDVEEVGRIMRDYDRQQHSYAHNEPITKEEIFADIDLVPSWGDYMEAKRSVPTSPKDFERAFIFTGDYKYDPQIQETLELFKSEGIPYTIYGGRGESLPQAVEDYINRNNPNLLFNNGGKLLTKKYGGGGNTQTPTFQLTAPQAASLTFLQQIRPDLYNRSQEVKLSDVDKAWQQADKDYEDFRQSLSNIKYRNTALDESEVVNITAPNTDISKFIFGNKITQNALNEIKRVAELRNQDAYDVLAHMLIEGSGNTTIGTDSYFNTHDVLMKQIKPVLFDYFKNDRVKQLKQFGIWQENKENYTAEEILKASEKIKSKRQKAIESIIVPESSIDAVALRMLLHGRDFNPHQKGLIESYFNDDGSITNKKVKHSYLDMVDSAIKSLKENMPDLFK